MDRHATEVRPERPDDYTTVRQVNELAFGRVEEANLVDALRTAGAALVSLVALHEKQIVGHILFSDVEVQGPSGTTRAVGLAPMAVLPALQRKGVGSALVREGLAALQRGGHRAVVVLGHPAYYPRFGFAPASQFGLRWEVDCPDGAFMALELVPGGMPSAGTVRFRPEFATV